MPTAPAANTSHVFEVTRPDEPRLVAAVAAAVRGAKRVDEGVCCVTSTAASDTRLGAVELGEAFEHIVQLDDTKLLLPVGLAARDCVFFDIESTGLRFEDCFAFVLGAAHIRNNHVFVEQIVPLGIEAELRAIEQFRRRVEGARAVVTFNGKRFDLPFLAARCELLGVESPLAQHEHVDLHPVSRRLLRKQLQRYSLAALEKSMLGMERVDDLPGREAPAAFLRFVATGDAGPLARVIEHNRLDLLTMIPLLAKLTGGAAPLSAEMAPTRNASPSTAVRPVAPAPAVSPQPAPARAPLPDLASDEMAANAFIALGARDDARAAELLRAALHSGLAGAMRRRALRELGRLLVASNHTVEAAEVLERACAETTGDGEAHALLAELYDERLGQPGHALRHAKRAVTLQPWNGPMKERVARLELLFS